MWLLSYGIFYDKITKIFCFTSQTNQLISLSSVILFNAFSCFNCGSFFFHIFSWFNNPYNRNLQRFEFLFSTSSWFCCDPRSHVDSTRLQFLIIPLHYIPTLLLTSLLFHYYLRKPWVFGPVHYQTEIPWLAKVFRYWCYCGCFNFPTRNNSLWQVGNKRLFFQ